MDFQPSRIFHGIKRALVPGLIKFIENNGTKTSAIQSAFCALESHIGGSAKRTKNSGSVGSEETTNVSVDTSSSLSAIDHTSIVASVIAQPSSRITSIYVGESGYGSILDVFRPAGSPKPRHITVNGTADAALDAGDLEYLKLKGCFELPAESEELLTAYFHFVHPIFPVIDGASFLRDYAIGGMDAMNLLLLWSMFSVSASYVPTCSGKERKALFVMRGKALFDISGENDKFVLIQSALLLSFWFDDAEDIKQSWYWSGIAFTIAQTLGLHQTPIFDTQQMSQTKRNTWKNLWHCCMIRDAWLSYTMGRPLRLNEASSSATLLFTADCHFRDMQLHKNNVYSEEEARELEKMWRSSVTAAHTLRQCQSPAPTITQPSILAMCLRDSQQTQQDNGTSLLLSLCGRNLKLCRNAAMIAISQSSGDEEMAEAAADETATIVRSYLRDTTIAYVPPSVVPLIMPAMLIFLSALKSKESHIRHLGERRLSSCVQLLNKIEQTFPAASIVKQLFDAANKALHANYHGRGSHVDAHDLLNEMMCMSYVAYEAERATPRYQVGIRSHHTNWQQHQPSIAVGSCFPKSAMRLIDTRTLKLEEILDPESSDIKYAILSHTWEHEEVSYQEFQDPEKARKKTGFSKIAKTCQLARERGLKYAWVDTCCIDKTSSAELTESINSMFNWYKHSSVCFTFFSDFECPEDWDTCSLKIEERLDETPFYASRWFTRGWTLQELIAPVQLIFYDMSWRRIATKVQLVSQLSLNTHIDERVLKDSGRLAFVPVCVRMSWAAERITTRIEDAAYSLLGIFGLNMPMIYGEGRMAFHRLQAEIIRQTNDLTILAWSPEDVDPQHKPVSYRNNSAIKYRGALAWSPKEFKCCRGLTWWNRYGPYGHGLGPEELDAGTQLSMKHNHLEISLQEVFVLTHTEEVLICVYVGFPAYRRLIRTYSGYVFANEHHRDRPDLLDVEIARVRVNSLRLLFHQESNLSITKAMDAGTSFVRLRSYNHPAGYTVVGVWPHRSYDTTLPGFAFCQGFGRGDIYRCGLLGAWLVKFNVSLQRPCPMATCTINVLLCFGSYTFRHVDSEKKSFWATNFVEESDQSASVYMHHQLSEAKSLVSLPGIDAGIATQPSETVLDNLAKGFEGRLYVPLSKTTSTSTSRRYDFGMRKYLPGPYRKDEFSPFAKGGQPTGSTLRVTCRRHDPFYRKLEDGSGSNVVTFDLWVEEYICGEWVTATIVDNIIPDTPHVS
ncbi:hypothetical protein G7046_g2639 [Stylonectria norvegica]|nr:hypothetical protein G7046_g2639 [Stylonectria norvegica]